MAKETPSTALNRRRPSPRSARVSQGGETSKLFARPVTWTSALLASDKAFALRRRVQPAGGKAASCRHQLRPLARATLEGLGAARMKGAAAGDGAQPRHRSVDLRQPRVAV